MAFWSKWWGSKEPEDLPDEGEGILVISDIHLGEDVLARGPEHLGDYIRVLNRELAAFVAAHREAAVESKRRWHLVINGDMFDFVKVSVEPDPGEAYERWSRSLGADDRIEQLPNTPRNVVFKLERILEIHRPLFKEFARFLLDGHSITMIEGNHDAEFYFQEVQRTLRAFLVKEAQKIHQKESSGGPENEFSAEKITSGVNFRTWFEASPGRYHIEHGHQYDQFCSFEYHLVPLDRVDSKELATPMSHRLMPYFTEMLGDFSTHGIDRWSLLKWMRYALTLGPKMIWLAFRIYMVAMWDLLSRAGSRRAEELQRLSEAHDAELEGMASRSPYGLDTLKSLDRLKATPAEYSLMKMMRIFYFDRFLVGLVWSAFLGLAVFLGGTWGLGLGLASTTTAALVLWALSRERVQPTEEVLRESAAQIADRTGARYVVFGHSHHPELVDLTDVYGVGRFGERAYYLNSGSWVTREILLGEEGKGMTYVELSAEGAALKRWRGKRQDPEIVASSYWDPAAPDRRRHNKARTAEREASPSQGTFKGDQEE